MKIWLTLSAALIPSLCAAQLSTVEMRPGDAQNTPNLEKVRKICESNCPDFRIQYAKTGHDAYDKVLNTRINRWFFENAADLDRIPDQQTFDREIEKRAAYLLAHPESGYGASLNVDVRALAPWRENPQFSIHSDGYKPGTTRAFVFESHIVLEKGSGKVLVLDDIVPRDRHKTLSQRVAAGIVQLPKDERPLHDGEKALPNNFYFSDEGLTFHFGGGYFGNFEHPLEYTLPWAQLRDLVDPRWLPEK